ncbi:MAG: helix-hairpin-helix domain-containing protein [Betaproteobacteria bacterium]|nr:MAG: helix-hairpin-helix domain-containing protein [Betaproteobacteria bacterium]
MKNAPLTTALMALALILGAAPSFAQDKPKTAPAPAAKSVKKATTAPKPFKPVDINGASKAELMKLSGISDAQADKIVAGRPYRSKADLVTRKIISEGLYGQIQRRIIALQKPEPPAKIPGK